MDINKIPKPKYKIWDIVVFSDEDARDCMDYIYDDWNCIVAVWVIKHAAYWDLEENMWTDDEGLSWRYWVEQTNWLEESDILYKL